MQIQETLVSLNYKKIESLKKNYYINEEVIKKDFNEATVLPIPDDAPFEVPRIIIKTHNEHSQLNITPVTATFQTRYDGGFETNWEQCKDYLLNKMGTVFGFLNSVTKSEYEYIGVVANILFDEYEQDGTVYLKKSLLDDKQLTNLYDLNVRYTFVENDNQFINITLQNTRLFPIDSNQKSAGVLSTSRQISNVIGAIIDINDRFGFNNKENYHTTPQMLEGIINTMSTVLNSRIQHLITKGEY